MPATGALCSSGAHKRSPAAAAVTRASSPAANEAAASKAPSNSASVELMGAEAYVLVDEQKIQRQRAANQNIRSLLGARRVAKAAISVPLAPNQGLCVGSLAPEGKAEPSDPAAEAAAAALDAASTVQSDAAQKAAQVPVPGDRKRPAHPLAEFMSLPDLLESSPSPPHRPLQPWQLQQHQQLLRLQQQELQQNDRRNRLWQSERGPSRGPKPLHHSRHHSDSAASPGAAAVAAAGAAAVAAGADFFGRLHAECLEVIRMLRPTEEESAKKREAAGRVLAVCSHLFESCSVEVFGSSFTALDLPGSDLDLCVFADTKPPCLGLYRCSQCLCCSESPNNSSSNNDGSSNSCSGRSDCRPSNRNETPVAPTADTCGREAASSTRCCCFRHGVSPSKGRGLCSSSCPHGGAEGLQQLLRAAAEDMGEDSHDRARKVDNICLFVWLLRELNGAVASGPPGGGGRAQRPRRGPAIFAERIEPILKARVPICKFRDAATGVSVDVSFDQPSALLTSLYVRFKVNEFPLLRPLLLINKLLLRHLDLHEPFKGGVGSYLLFAMKYVFMEHLLYLLTSRALPKCFQCLHFLQNNPRLRDAKQQRHLNLGHLLFEFLHYYGCQFNYAHNTISVRDNGSLWPKRGAARGAQTLRLSAESPLDRNRDIGSTAYKIMAVRAVWRRAYLRLACRLASEVRRGAPEKDDPGSACVDVSAVSRPLLCCLFGDSWPKELSTKSRLSNNGQEAVRGLATQRPGIWVTKAVQKKTQGAVQRILTSSKSLMKALDKRVNVKRSNRTFIDVKDDVLTCDNDDDNDKYSVSSDSDSAEESLKFPWMRRQLQQRPQKRPRRFGAIERDNTISPSSSPRLVPMSATATTAARRSPSASDVKLKRIASPGISASNEPIDKPELITVDGSSGSDSSVVEMPLQHAGRDSMPKRKKRKQRDAEEKEKRRKVGSMHTIKK